MNQIGSSATTHNCNYKRFTNLFPIDFVDSLQRTEEKKESKTSAPSDTLT